MLWSPSGEDIKPDRKGWGHCRRHAEAEVEALDAIGTGVGGEAARSHRRRVVIQKEDMEPAVERKLVRPMAEQDRELKVGRRERDFDAVVLIV